MAAVVATQSPRIMGSPIREIAEPRKLKKSFSLGGKLDSTFSTSETIGRDKEKDPPRCSSSPTEALWLNLKENYLPDDTPLDETSYTPRDSKNPSPVLFKRRQSRKSSNFRDGKRLSQLSETLGLTSRRPDSDNDSVFGSPTKPNMNKRRSILRRKSSFGGFTAPSSPVLQNPKILKKTVSFGNLANLTARSSFSDGNASSNTPRRLSSIGAGSQDDPDEQMGKGKKTRRMSMMSSLREELMQVDKVNVKKYAETQSHQKAADIGVKREKSEEIIGDKNAKVMLARAKQRPSMPSLMSSRSDSLSSEEQLLSSYDMKKIEMLQSLRKMGVDLKKMRTSQAEIEYNNLPRSQRVRLCDESNILRKAAARGNRHGSLTSRTIISNFEGVEPLKASDPTPELLDAATREKLQKIYDQMVKPDAKVVTLPGLVGRNRHSVTGDEMASETVNVFRRKIRRRKKPPNRFQRLSRFVLVLLRLWGHHAKQVNELLEYVQSVDMDDENKKGDLLFDITEFKAEKEAHVPQEAKRILRKRPSERTDDEVHYVQIALRNYKSLAEYPVHMQKKIAAKAWFEGYEMGREVNCEGQATTFPALARCARRHMFAAITSAGAKRSFFLYDLILSGRRSLAEDTFRCLTFLYYNNFSGSDSF